MVYGRFDYGRRGYVGLLGLLDVTTIEVRLAGLPLLLLDRSAALSMILFETTTLLLVLGQGAVLVVVVVGGSLRDRRRFTSFRRRRGRMPRRR